MTTKQDIIQAIQEAADESNPAPPHVKEGEPRLRVALGEPGDVIDLEGDKWETGRGWEPLPTAYDKIIEGLAVVLDDKGIGDVAAIKAKVNELVGGYMQLKTDYNNGTVPTTAPDIAPLP